MVALGDEQVGRLDVAVDDAAPVRRIEGVGHLSRQRDDPRGRHRAVLDQFTHGHALEALHDDEGLALVLAEFVDGADVRVLERGGETGLSAEPAQPFARGRGLGMEDLDRDFAPEPGVLGAMHLAHAADPEQAEKAIVREEG